jgi:hypothetical protein
MNAVLKMQKSARAAEEANSARAAPASDEAMQAALR